MDVSMSLRTSIRLASPGSVQAARWARVPWDAPAKPERRAGRSANLGPAPPELLKIRMDWIAGPAQPLLLFAGASVKWAWRDRWPESIRQTKNMRYPY